MFYDALTNEHGLKHDPFKALIVPRPVGWVSSVDPNGVPNLAPYSFFNAVSEKPGWVMFASGGPKDSMLNIAEAGEFVCSLATYELREAVNFTSAKVARGVDEFALAGLTPAPSRFVKPPRVKESPAALECRHWRTIELPDPGHGGRIHYVVFGTVVGIYIDDRFVKGGIVDTGAMRPIARLGYRDYAVVTPETVFTLGRPEVDAAGNVSVPEAAE
jgi:flavin reductase (DIM6/NTAB) family NADH-FMN oxidoreductase RutF